METLKRLTLAELKEKANELYQKKYFFVSSSTTEPNMRFSIIHKLIGCTFLGALIFVSLFFFEVLIPIILISAGIIEQWPSIKSSSFERSLSTAITSALLVPIAEEIVGRLWIVYRRLNISMAVSLILGIFVYSFFGNDSGLLWYQNYKILAISSLVTIIVCFSLFYYLSRNKQEYLINFWVRNQSKIVVLSAFIFAILHFRHYDISFHVFIISPILLAFYFSTGLILGYARVRYGFIYCCLIHVFYNSILIFIKYVS